MLPTYKNGPYTAVHGALQYNSYCLCGKMHVEAGAKLIAIAGLILTALAILWEVFFHGSIFNAAVTLVCGSVDALILLAQKERKPAFYLPFLIFNGLAVIVLMSIAFLNVVFIAMMPVNTQHAYFTTTDPSSGMPMLAHLAIVLVVTAILAWLQWVVYKAYKFMKNSQ